MSLVEDNENIKNQRAHNKLMKEDNGLQWGRIVVGGSSTITSGFF